MSVLKSPMTVVRLLTVSTLMAVMSASAKMATLEMVNFVWLNKS